MTQSKFLTALQSKDRLTENGMPTHSTSGRKVVDLFYKMGGARKVDAASVTNWFAQAFGESPMLAAKALFYNRDVRGGQGERETFRTMFRWLAENAPETALRNIPNVAFFGRWDDLLYVTVGTPVEQAALDFYAEALRAGEGLAAKWAPREGKSEHELANKLRKALKLSWQDYRKLLSGNTRVIETAMCAKEWAAINYSHVPSIASKRYRKAFYKRDADRYAAWVAELQKPVAERDPKVKVNAAAIFPHDVLRPFVQGNTANVTERNMLQAQWAALPNYVPDGQYFLPISDVSGSMYGEPMEVSVALGIYLAERNKGPFKDALITFSESPTLFVLKQPDLQSRVKEVMNAQWGMNTNVEKVFKLILSKAKAAKLAQEDLPQTLLILSDMQFDQCISGKDNSALEMVDRMYATAGYTRPNLVFWNLRTASGVPVKVDERGTALVSGFSPSILEQVLSGKDMTPQAVMLRKLTSDRYERVVA